MTPNLPTPEEYDEAPVTAEDTLCWFAIAVIVFMATIGVAMILLPLYFSVRA